jgi:membrane-associated phospholipid phosphatase
MTEHAYTAGALHPRRLIRRESPGAAGPLGVAGLCILALALVWLIAEHVSAAQVKDAVVLHDFTLLERPRVDNYANFLLHLLNPLQFVLWGVALMALAIARERPRVALAVAAIMGFAPLTAEILKPLLAHPHVSVDGVYVGAASWPSGHASAATALAYAAVLVSPVRVRPLVAGLGATFVLAVGCSLLILAWHMPSDVLGGYLVGTLWAALAVAAVRGADRRWPPRVGVSSLGDS